MISRRTIAASGGLARARSPSEPPHWADEHGVLGSVALDELYNYYLSITARRPFRRILSLGRKFGRRRRRGQLPPVCDSVKAWSEQQPGLECQIVLAAGQIQRALPRTIEPEVLETYRAQQVASFREKYLVPIPGARVVGRHGLVILPDGTYAAESVYNRTLLAEDPDYQAPRRRPVVNKPGSYFSLLNVWAQNARYYHWLHDSVQRLSGVLETLPSDVQYLVPADLQPWQIETLRLLGIRDTQLAHFDATQVWRLETLYFTTATTNSGGSRREVEVPSRGVVVS